MPELQKTYRGRLAPSPTGLLHVGHARTFWIAQQRAQQAVGRLALRNEDLDPQRSKEHFTEAMLEDLKWFGFVWDEGPDLGGPHAPYCQGERVGLYKNALEILKEKGFVYPCSCSRRDVLEAAGAPHEGDEPLYPGICRPDPDGRWRIDPRDTPRVNWRFRVPDGETVSYHDGSFGAQHFTAGSDFGDFVAWRHDNVPGYQLAVVVDDAAMEITEVVRGADLLKCTARQLLLYRALELPLPAFHHCPLMTDENGHRLAKRHDSLSLRSLREQGKIPEEIRAGWNLTGLSPDLCKQQV